MKTYIYTSLISLTIGLAIGILLDQFFIPRLFLKEEVREIQTYEISNNASPVEEVPPSDPCPLSIDVSGAVNKPGVYCLPLNSTINDAINIAEGLKKNVATNFVAREINLVQPLQDNQKIYIPKTTDVKCVLQNFNSYVKEVVEVIENKQTTGQTTKTSEEEKKEDKVSDCIHINNATLEQLDTLEGVGPSTAQKIINGRPYTKLEDLLNVSGIGQATYDKFKEKICL